MKVCGGQPTCHRQFGKGNRHALMFHCSMAHSGAFMPLASGLKDQLHMVAFDMPGHGGSADWDGVTPLQRQTVDMALDLLADMPGPVDLIGHSFGGTAALRLACERPDLVRSLILIEPVFFAAAYADHPGLGATHMAEMAEIAQAIEAGDRETAARAFLRVWGNGQVWAELPEQMRQKAMEQIHLVIAANPEVCEDSAGLLTSGAVQGLPIPTLLLEGALSPHYVAKINAALATRITGSQRVVVEGAGHMLPLSHPRQVAMEISQFLASVPMEHGLVV
jgi:pimeloyl-ACP methyl ester carboxylesterase